MRPDPVHLRVASSEHGGTRYRRPPDPWVVAVEPDAVQVSWRDVPPGAVELDARWADNAGMVHATGSAVVGDRGAGATVTVDGLPADTTVQLELTHECGASAGCTARTLAPPPGPELFRFATLSDLHLGSRGFGYFSTMHEHPTPATPLSTSAARAALREALAWGAQLIVLKGDLTERAQPEEWELLGDLVRSCPVPIVALGGNHDVSPNEGRIDAHQALSDLGIGSPASVQVFDAPGTAVVLADTTVALRDLGHVRHVTDGIVHAARTAQRDGRWTVVALHHQLQTTPVPLYWPPGVSSLEGRRLTARLSECAPGTIVTSGHTHRNRARRSGDTIVTEVASPKDYPGVWGGYVVHAGGVRQVVRRVEAASVHGRIEATAAAALGTWARWAPGSLADRCLVVERPGG